MSYKLDALSQLTNQQRQSSEKEIRSNMWMDGWVSRCQKNSYHSSTEWLKRPAVRPYTSWLATIKNGLSFQNLSAEDATKLVLDRPLGGLLAASGAMHW